ncbi:hypothetical protein PM082_017851 [Marasmius tenuissimus]|nr:hypothetical protein PM082_017851 [Marasmius tenuissimus]
MPGPHNLSQRTIVVSGFTFSPFSKSLLGTLTRYHPLEWCTYDAKNRTLLLRFVTEDDLVSFYHKNATSPQSSKLRIFGPNTLSKHPTLNRELPYHKDLAIKLGACRTLYLGNLPRSVIKTKLGPRGEINLEPIAHKIEQDMAPHGTVLHVSARLSGDTGSPYVQFSDIDSAVKALLKLHLAVRGKAGPLEEYKDLSIHDFAAPPLDKKGRSIYLNRNLRAHLLR